MYVNMPVTKNTPPPIERTVKRPLSGIQQEALQTVKYPPPVKTHNYGPDFKGSLQRYHPEAELVPSDLYPLEKSKPRVRNEAMTSS